MCRFIGVVKWSFHYSDWMSIKLETRDFKFWMLSSAVQRPKSRPSLLSFKYSRSCSARPVRCRMVPILFTLDIVLTSFMFVIKNDVIKILNIFRWLMEMVMEYWATFFKVIRSKFAYVILTVIWVNLTASIFYNQPPFCEY